MDDDPGSEISGDDDLAEILTNIAWGARPEVRTRTARSSDTRAFLQVGVRLLHEDLLDHQGPNFDDPGAASNTRLLSHLSQARLIERAERDFDDQKINAHLTVSKYRERWRYKMRYTEDLIAFIFRLAPQRDHLNHMQTMGHELIGRVSLDELIRQLVAHQIDKTIGDPILNLQTILQVAIPHHPRVREFLQVHYDQWLPRWADIYELIASAHGLRLRDQFTWLDIAELFNAIFDGYRVRARASGRAVIVSSKESLIEAAIFAVLPGIIADLPPDLTTVFAPLGPPPD